MFFWEWKFSLVCLINNFIINTLPSNSRMVQCLLNCLERSQTIISNSMGVMWLQDIPDYYFTSGRMQAAHVYIYLNLIISFLFKATVPFSTSFSSYSLSHRSPGHFAYRVSHSLKHFPLCLYLLHIGCWV